MDIKKYIASGILENYVLGLVNEDERKQIEKNITKHPEVKSKLDEIEETLEQYAQRKGVPPPENLINNIIDHIRIEESPIQNSKSNKFWIAAALFALLSSLLLFLFFFQKSNELENEKLENNLLKEKYESKEEKFIGEIDILRNVGGSVITMNGTDKSPKALTKTYWNESKQTTYLDVVNLPTAPTNKQYQLWAIVDGNPVDMGVLEINPTDRLIAVPFIKNPTAFAITLEKKGGSPTPNLDELVVIGNV